MASKYWLKLYHEILQDPKMGMLPDNLWRRTIELFLLAGENSNDLPEDEIGSLPSTTEIAWKLRRPEDELAQELHELAEIGIITPQGGTWKVTNFAKRQAAVSDADRMKEYRKRKRQAPADPEPEPELPPEPPSDNTPTSDNGTDNVVVTRSVTERNTDNRIQSKNKDTILTSREVRDNPTKNQKASREMFQALVDACQVDLKVITKKDRGAINQAEKKMREAGYCPDDIQGFVTWWYEFDWRGKKTPPQPPKLNDIRETWGQYKNHINGIKPVKSEVTKAAARAAEKPKDKPDPLVELWEQVKSAVGLQMSRATWEQNFRYSKLISLNGVAVVEVSSEAAAYHLNRPRQKELVESCLTSYTDKASSIEFVVKGAI